MSLICNKENLTSFSGLRLAENDELAILISRDGLSEKELTKPDNIKLQIHKSARERPSEIFQVKIQSVDDISYFLGNDLQPTLGDGRKPIDWWIVPLGFSSAFITRDEQYVLHYDKRNSRVVLTEKTKNYFEDRSNLFIISSGVPGPIRPVLARNRFVQYNIHATGSRELLTVDNPNAKNITFIIH